MTVLCNNHKDGCKWEGPLRDLEDHLDECPYSPSECPFNCGETLSRKDLDEHKEKYCEKRKILCPHCSKHIHNANLEKHVQSECPVVEVECKFNCGVGKMPRSKMNEHIDPDTGDCTKAEIACPCCDGGCNQKLLRCDLDAHLTDPQFLGKHILGFYSTLVTMKKGDNKEQRLRQAEEKAQRAEALVQIFDAEKRQLQQRVMKLEEKVDNLLVINTNTEKKVSDLEMALQLAKNEAKRLEQELHLGSLERREFVLGADVVTDANLEAPADISKLDVQRTGQEISESQLLVDIESCKQKIRDFEKQVNSMDRMTAARDISMAEQDLRLQVLESSFYDGILLWKIPNFRRRRQDAVSGRTPSLYSPPFFTSRRGYKMCGRVYLNGDGMGKGTHLSLFFVVMKGQFDALLPWPFRQRVTLMVLDQSSTQRHTLDTFRPDPQSSSFQRPVNDMNVASGCPLFIPIDSLDRKGFVKDDTLFVCIKVDCSNLPQF
jgi:hypothetical protein